MAKIHTFEIMQLKYLFSCLFIALLSSTLYSQTLIKGNVQDQQTREPIIGAWIRLLDSPANEGTLSDANGNFSLPLKQSGKVKLEVKYTGYETYTDQIQIIENTETIVNVLLSEGNVLLQTMVISSSRSEKPISESTISLDIIRPEYPEKLNSTSVQQVLDRIPGVQILDGQANIRGGSGWRNQCRMFGIDSSAGRTVI